MENENNIKGVGLKALFKAYMEPSVPNTEQTSSKLDELFAKIWERRDRQAEDLTDNGKKPSSKKKNKGMQGIQMKQTQTPTLEKTDSSKEINHEHEEFTK